MFSDILFNYNLHVTQVPLDKLSYFHVKYVESRTNIKRICNVMRNTSAVWNPSLNAIYVLLGPNGMSMLNFM